MLNPPINDLDLSGERFSVVYHLTGTETEARAMATDLCVEQTVEFPADLLPAGDIRERIVGRVESVEAMGPRRYEAVVSFAVETAGGELTQLLNLLFGNISIKPGVRLERLELTPSILGPSLGPRFGRSGLRAILDVPQRPLLCTALKPMGLAPETLADLAYQFALGGMDLVKDDHGLADQPFCPFRERVARCGEAVARANRKTGRKALYVPNVTAPSDRIWDRVRLAKEAGAGGILVAPGLIGFDTMRRLARDDAVDLPILSHPALLGGFVVSDDHGISHHALFGQIMRLAGADAVIFPNFGGRFAFTPEQCRRLAESAAAPMGEIRPGFPTPAGGMSLDRVPEMLAFYGREAVFLIGGDLHRGGPDLVGACRRFASLVSDEP